MPSGVGAQWARPRQSIAKAVAFPELLGSIQRLLNVLAALALHRAKRLCHTNATKAATATLAQGSLPGNLAASWLGERAPPHTAPVWGSLVIGQP